MIAYLFGTVIHVDSQHLILNVNGVGYKVYAKGNDLQKTAIGKEISFWTYLSVKENALDLYGFHTQDELGFFELLITVSGIGPKKALGILNLVPIESLRQAVRTENVSHLVKVSGIGGKIAEKIILELRGKLGKAGEMEAGTLRDESDVVEALYSLGYSQKEAREALKEISEEIIGAGEKVKEALKILGKNKK